MPYKRCVKSILMFKLDKNEIVCLKVIIDYRYIVRRNRELSNLGRDGILSYDFSDFCLALCYIYLLQISQ